MFYIERMYLYEVAELINRKDIRAVIYWCKKSHVQIHSNSSGKFITKNDFALAYNLPLIKDLKVKYGDKWEAMYVAYLDNKLHEILDMGYKIKDTSRYIPKGNIARSKNKNH
jgi:hypothetical protein